MRNLLYSQKSIKKLKPAGDITIGFACSEWAEIEMAIEVHCDDGVILTKGGKAQIGICVFVREKTNGADKDKVAHGDFNIMDYRGGALKGGNI